MTYPLMHLKILTDISGLILHPTINIQKKKNLLLEGRKTEVNKEIKEDSKL